MALTFSSPPFKERSNDEIQFRRSLNCVLPASTHPPPLSFYSSDSSEYTQIIRRSPVVVKVQMPMLRSASYRSASCWTQNLVGRDVLEIFSLETKEQRSKKRRSQSMDDIFNPKMETFGKFPTESVSTSKAMSDCARSHTSDSSYASAGSNSSSSTSDGDSSSSPSCEISLVERLIRTHPIWFLPSLQRSGALHLLQGREVGNFIVRGSTHPMTMAVSVKLPGSLVEHYLLHAVDNQIALENSVHTFQTVHQLIAHYSAVSDEIPVCLRVPGAIAEATTRQQLRSLALLGQEFWTHSPSGKELLSPSDAEVSKTFNSSGLGSQSQSSSSQNSLSESRKPCRPTTLELGNLGPVPTGVRSVVTPPPVPPRWSRSALLTTPLSLPSSIQSTPSEIQSTFSEKGTRRGVIVKKKKRNSGSDGNNTGKEPIHYKDTEILDIFKGTKTSYDDKASDYEDIWSPQYSSKPQIPLGELPRLSTFKPDLIASSFGSDLDSLYKNNLTSTVPSKCQFQSLSAVNNNEDRSSATTLATNNSRNHRLSFNGNTYNFNHHRSQQELIEHLKKNGSTLTIEESHHNNVTTIPITPTGAYVKTILSKSKASLYSEPVDAIVFRRQRNYRHSEPNIRWSQPAMMSLVNVENHLPDIPQSPEHISMNTENKQIKPQEPHPSNFSNVNVLRHDVEDHPGKENVGGRIDRTIESPAPVVKARKSQNTVTCLSVDNLCHLRDIRKRTRSRLNCGGGIDGVGSEDEDEDVKLPGLSTGDTLIDLSKNGNPASVVAANKNIVVKPKPLPRKRSIDLKLENEISGTEDTEPQHHDASTNRSWHLDNSWEFVNWEKGEESMTMAPQKFPVPLQTGFRSEDLTNNNPGEEYSRKEDEQNMNHPTLNVHRFSRYDNLESREVVGLSSGVGDEGSDGDDNDKISEPWDSSKWEHLLRIVSESTQQLDSIQVADQSVLTTGLELRRHVTSSKYLTETKQRISKILDVSGNVDKAGKAITVVVRDLADKGSIFGKTLKSFISCTIAAKSQDPYTVMRNTRQFISGMKNYLVGVSEESQELRNEIKRQTERLTDSEFLDIDAILEEVLVDLVISPLHLHIRGLLETHHQKNSEPLKLLNSSSSQLHSHLQTHGLYPFPLSQRVLESVKTDSPNEKVKKIIMGFEDSVSPVKKLDKWNEFVCQVQELDNYSSESFLPLLSEVMGSVCSASMESHVDYMIGLLPHSMAERNNYSISLLQSALAALKLRKDRKGSTSLTSIRVIVPDERSGTLIRKMVPIRDTTTTKEVAKIVASKVGIVNPGDYVLVRIKNGEEKLCPEGELVSNFLEDSGTALAFKRMDAKIGWPLKMS